MVIARSRVGWVGGRRKGAVHSISYTEAVLPHIGMVESQTFEENHTLMVPVRVKIVRRKSSDGMRVVGVSADTSLP